MRHVIVALVLLALAVPVAAQTTHTVTVRNFEFDPATLTIEAGDTVRWTNAAGAHNVNSLTGPQAFDSGAVSAAQWEYEFTFTEVGTSTYQCDAHAGIMQGSVTVTQNTSTEDPTALDAATLRHDGPNPFRETARLALALREPSEVRVAVFDALGREVAVLFEGTAPAGETSLAWNAGAGHAAVFVVRALGAGLDASVGIARLGDHVGGH